MRVLLAAKIRTHAEAIDLFTYRIAGETGALVSALGGLDGLVFTAGIGEHASGIRAARMRPPRLAWAATRQRRERGRRRLHQRTGQQRRGPRHRH